MKQIQKTFAPSASYLPSWGKTNIHYKQPTMPWLWRRDCTSCPRHQESLHLSCIPVSLIFFFRHTLMQPVPCPPLTQTCRWKNPPCRDGWLASPLKRRSCTAEFRCLLNQWYKSEGVKQRQTEIEGLSSFRSQLLMVKWMLRPEHRSWLFLMLLSIHHSTSTVLCLHFSISSFRHSTCVYVTFFVNSQC